MEAREQETVGQSHEAEIRAALERVVASSHLSKSPQLANFLRFVVEETLAGRGDRIKAYSIAADALGRDASFDADHDPIVRVSAGRLRRALSQYYMDGGLNDPVIIELPRGNYMPEFRANTSRQRSVARLHRLRRQFARTVREYYPQVLLIVVVATCVSLGLDYLWMAIEGRGHAPASMNALQALPPPLPPDITGGLKP